jgi:hypothetical protein
VRLDSPRVGAQKAGGTGRGRQKPASREAWEFKHWVMGVSARFFVLIFVSILVEILIFVSIFVSIFVGFTAD